ncbi:MAG TPA: hypothetical protein VFU10_01190 [Gaiellaceae bacterium]|nr:hypothetical protein [Gaiellaceae bacterium]
MVRKNPSGVALVLVLALAIFAGAGYASSGKHHSSSTYSGTLTATPNVLHAGDYFTVSGCGYDTSLGNVVVGFTGGSWGSALDANGCFTVSGIPALSGDTLPAGTYPVTASQYVRGKWAETGETTVTVVS